MSFKSCLWTLINCNGSWGNKVTKLKDEAQRLESRACFFCGMFRMSDDICDGTASVIPGNDFET